MKVEVLSEDTGDIIEVLRFTISCGVLSFWYNKVKYRIEFINKNTILSCKEVQLYIKSCSHNYFQYCLVLECVDYCTEVKWCDFYYRFGTVDLIDKNQVYIGVHTSLEDNWLESDLSNAPRVNTQTHAKQVEYESLAYGFTSSWGMSELLRRIGFNEIEYTMSQDKLFIKVFNGYIVSTSLNFRELDEMEEFGCYVFDDNDLSYYLFGQKFRSAYRFILRNNNVVYVGGGFTVRFVSERLL